MNAPAGIEHLRPGLDHQHLDGLEEEAIFILREVAASFERPALFFSGGKDSCVRLRHGHRRVQARLAAITSCLDIPALQPEAAHALDVNQIGEVVFERQQPLPLAAYADNRVGGALVVVDPASHCTSGALLVRHVLAAA